MASFPTSTSMRHGSFGRRRHRHCRRCAAIFSSCTVRRHGPVAVSLPAPPRAGCGGEETAPLSAAVGIFRRYSSGEAASGRPPSPQLTVGGRSLRGPGFGDGSRPCLWRTASEGPLVGRVALKAHRVCCCTPTHPKSMNARSIIRRGITPPGDGKECLGPAPAD